MPRCSTKICILASPHVQQRFVLELILEWSYLVQCNKFIALWSAIALKKACYVTVLKSYISYFCKFSRYMIHMYPDDQHMNSYVNITYMCEKTLTPRKNDKWKQCDTKHKPHIFILQNKIYSVLCSSSPRASDCIALKAHFTFIVGIHICQKRCSILGGSPDIQCFTIHNTITYYWQTSQVSSRQ